MIGFLKPYKMELLVKDCTYYKLYYCSICRHLVRNNLRMYAWLNSYEGTLLAMIYNEMVVQDISAVKDRCSGIPIVKVPVLPPDHPAVELGAMISMLAFQVKFRDNLLDEEGGFTKAYNKFFLHRVNRSFEKKQDVYRKFQIDLDYISEQQKALNRLELDETIKEADSFLEAWGVLFAYIMTQAFKGKIDDRRYKALSGFFRGLGKIINLLDAMSDVHEDSKNGQFNPILRSESSADLDNPEWLNTAFTKYGKIIQSERKILLQLLPEIGLRESLAIVQNILSDCLDKELEKVFLLMVEKKQTNQRMLFNCNEF